MFDIIIKEEEEKLDKAKILLKQLNSVWFSMFNPRFWKIKKELDKTIKSFRSLNK